MAALLSVDPEWAVPVSAAAPVSRRGRLAAAAAGLAAAGALFAWTGTGGFIGQKDPVPSVVTPQQDHAALRTLRELVHGNGLSGRRLDGGAPKATDNAECRIEEGSECPLSELARDTSTLIYPGGETRCLFSYSSEYAFQVIPGDEDKLLIHFQGGGSCWDQQSTTGLYGSTCADSAYSEAPWNGIFRREPSSKSPFKDYTIVVVLYCSGDVHVGNTTRAYTDLAGENVTQRGYENSLSAISWARENLGSVDSLVVSGSSAGALGAQLWAARILGGFKYARASVIVDSYLDIFPANTELALMTRIGACQPGSEAVIEKLFPDREVSCGPGFNLRSAFTDTVERFPKVTFAAITSKSDLVQIAYYNAVAITFGQEPTMEQKAFLGLLTAALYELNKRPNFITYEVEGPQHAFLTSNALYNTQPPGPFNRHIHTDQPSLVDWLSHFPLSQGDSVAAQCWGWTVNYTLWEDYANCNCQTLCDWVVANKVVQA